MILFEAKSRATAMHIHTWREEFLILSSIIPTPDRLLRRQSQPKLEATWVTTNNLLISLHIIIRQTGTRTSISKESFRLRQQRCTQISRIIPSQWLRRKVQCSFATISQVFAAKEKKACWRRFVPLACVVGYCHLIQLGIADIAKILANLIKRYYEQRRRSEE